MNSTSSQDSRSEGSAPVSINDFVDELVVALVNTRIYLTEHPRVSASIDELIRLLGLLTQSDPRESIAVEVLADQLVFEQRPLLGASLSAPRLIKALRGYGAGGVRFDLGATAHDFRSILTLLCEKPGEEPDLDRIQANLETAGCRHARLLKEAKTDVAELPLSNVPVQLYQGLVETLQDTTISICHGGMISFERSQASIESVLRSMDGGDPGGMMSAVRYERYDAYTFGHSIRVAVLALTFARSMTSNPGLLNRIGVAALLHDVGKAQVPFEVLHCRTRLSAEQRHEMEKHPEYGAQILMDQKGCDPMAYGAAFGHHLADDGRGYPKLFRDPKVSLVTKIVKICDVFEALTAERPYKAGMSPLRAYRIMIGMGELFDQGMLKRFIRTVGLFPAGTRVALDSGEEARVVAQSDDLLKPLLMLETDAGGAPLEGEDQELVDLSRDVADRGGCLGCEIARVVDKVDMSEIAGFGLA